MKKISAVIIDTYDERAFTHLAIKQTLELGFVNKLYTISHKPILQGEEFYKINKIKSIADYNNIVLNFLPLIIEESHFLIIQWDGFPINKEMWTEEFLQYDYIGAPWMHLDESICVGNGGFSLRSRKLLDFQQSKSLFDSSSSQYAEDQIICQLNRMNLESNGIKFANKEKAMKFSFESGVMRETFGFHGGFNFPFFIQKEFLKENEDEIISKMKRKDMLDLYFSNKKT